MFGALLALYILVVSLIYEGHVGPFVELLKCYTFLVSC